LATERDVSKRASIQPAYDSRRTGPPYQLTCWVNGHRADGWDRLYDPFARRPLRIGWRDLLSGLLHHGLVIEVQTSTDPDIREDVLELDANYLGEDCTRRDAYNTSVRTGSTAGYTGPFPDCLSDEDHGWFSRDHRTWRGDRDRGTLSKARDNHPDYRPGWAP
jgi:hypothetical protein